MKVIFLNDTDKFLRIRRIRSISGLLQAICPRLVVRNLIVKQEFVTVSIPEEVGMVTIGLLRGGILSEAFTLTVIVMIHFPSRPVVMTLYTEMIVSLDGKFGKAITRFKQSLSQRNAGRYPAPVHLFYRKSRKLSYIDLLRRIAGLGSIGGYEGLVCEARVVSVILDGIFVEIFGVDVYIPIYELSHVRLSDAMGYFEPGDRILVKITKIKRDDLNRIRVSASVKQVTSNPVDKVIEKLEVGSCYAGTVSMADETGIFVNLDMGAECRCPFPYRSRPPKDARAIVKIGGIDMKRKIVWGTITYVTIPK